jgi:hypothetical protein
MTMLKYFDVSTGQAWGRAMTMTLAREIVMAGLKSGHD